MPDINLIKNTLRPEPNRKKEKEDKPFFALTHPSKQEKKIGEGKAPSSLSLFFKSLFSRKPKENKEPGIVEERIVKKATSDLPRSSATFYHKEDNVEDIFEKDTPEKEAESFTALPSARPFPIKEKMEDILKEDLKEELSLPSSAKSIPPLPPPAPSPKREKKEKEKKPEDHSFLVNLLPEELVGHDDPRKKIINLSLIILGAVLLVTLSYFGLFFYQKNLVEKTENAKKERLAVEDQIKSREEEQNQSIELKKSLDNIKSLLTTHIYWTKFFEKIEKYTLPDVYYTGGFNASTSGLLILQATAPDFETVSKQLVVLKNASDFVQDVSITSAQRQSASVTTILPEGAVLASHVTFAINLNLASDIFYKTEEEIENSSETDTDTNANTENLENTNFNTNENINSANLNDNINQNDNFNSNITLPL